MPPRGRRYEEPRRPSAPLWVLTYADMVTLLLAFFVLIAAYSTMDAAKVRNALQSVQGTLGVSTYGGAQETPVVTVPETSRTRMEDILKVARDFRERMQVLGKSGDIKIEVDKSGGLRIVLPVQLLFGADGAALEPAADAILTPLAEALSVAGGVTYEISGHTDSQPLKNAPGFNDNYELSFARALGVARFLRERGGESVGRYEIAARGPIRPVTTNETNEGRQANQRIEIYVYGPLSMRESEEVRGGSRTATSSASSQGT